MPHALYSVEQVARLLNLHVRTVRHYVREGRLRAVRIGKQYRIAREDLEAMAGRPPAPLDTESVHRERYVEVSSIVEIDAISPETASRLMTMLMGAAKTGREPDQPLRIETLHHEERARLKVILTGNITTVCSFLQFIAGYLDRNT